MHDSTKIVRSTLTRAVAGEPLCLSAGLEDVDDLLAGIAQALDALC
jgi:cystathionine beta-lyase/cystathionine gamma-synthase